MATVECPNGHQSATTDYCDQCGVRLQGNATAAPPTKPVGTPATTSALTCPNCQSPRAPDEKFCEVCGYDFVAGTLPKAPTPTAAVPTTGPAWQAVVTADRAYYDKGGASDVAFPDHCPERVFALTESEMLIGRRSESRGIHPQIDLGGAPEDTGISRSQAILRRQSDGTWTVIDPGSTNGTMLNDGPDPIPQNTAITLKDGDRLYVGAWTRIVLHAPPSP
jgi:hypothetical protein